MCLFLSGFCLQEGNWTCGFKSRSHPGIGPWTASSTFHFSTWTATRFNKHVITVTKAGCAPEGSALHQAVKIDKCTSKELMDNIC